jgi:hypothetical protein
MNRRLALAALTLAFAALPARAGGFGFCLDTHLAGSFNFSCTSSCCGPCGPCGPCGSGCVAPLAPWYLYWPMDAHFQTPAPMTYPFWPAPQTPPAATTALQPASYHPNAYPGGVPSYWYGYGR